jgi:Helix-turn-helix domain
VTGRSSRIPSALLHGELRRRDGKSLKPLAVWLCALILDHAEHDDDGACRESKDTLASQMGCDRKTVGNAQRELVDAGLVEAEKMGNQSGKITPLPPLLTLLVDGTETPHQQRSHAKVTDGQLAPHQRDGKPRLIGAPTRPVDVPPAERVPTRPAAQQGKPLVVGVADLAARVDREVAAKEKREAEEEELERLRTQVQPAPDAPAASTPTTTDDQERDHPAPTSPPHRQPQHADAQQTPHQPSDASTRPAAKSPETHDAPTTRTARGPADTHERETRGAAREEAGRVELEPGVLSHGERESPAAPDAEGEPPTSPTPPLDTAAELRRLQQVRQAQLEGASQ